MTDPAPTALRTFEELRSLLTRAMDGHKPLRLMLAVSPEPTALRAIGELARRGWIAPILVGDQHEAARMGEALEVPVEDWERIHVRGPGTALLQAIDLAAAGRTDLIMKGSISAHDLLRVLLQSKRGYRGPGERLTHVGVFEIENYPRLLLVSDGAVMVRPGIEDRIFILKQAAGLARMLGVDCPRVALLAAVETVSEGVHVAIESAALAKMAERHQLGDMIVDGPLSLDLSVSPESAAIKNVKSEVAGRADIIICSKIEVATVLYKALVLFARARTGGVAIGTRCPIVMPSWAEDAENQVHAIELALACCLHARGELRR